ncbi:MAG: discoidin domain-containing protein, partial [Marinoscillum sp.]
MKLNKILLITLLLWGRASLFAQTTVSSLDELIPYLEDDNVHVKLEPGTYSVTAEDIRNGRYGKSFGAGEHINNHFVIFPFEGNNSTYDFTGVTINVKTETFTTKGSVDFREIRVIGSHNVLLNLTLVDDGSVNDAPASRAQNLVVDGAYNRIEGFHVTVKGSFPYGYGDAFGKGGGSVINHRKHSACLVRGESNHIKNCTFIQRSYGHCIFMQAASNPVIEGCTVEGEVRSTDDMLTEEGTGSPADNVDFMTVWGYRLPPGYMLSLAEGGIRAYNAGSTIVGGVEYSRGTSNPTVKNCTIKYMRTGVTLAHATGTKYVEGCTVIGCENGFSLGSGDVVNCSADCTYGPVYSSTYESDKNYNADITLLPASDPYYNGSGSIAYIGGSGHNIVLRGSEEAIQEGLTVKVGGDKNNIRLLYGNLPHQNDFSGSNFTLQNLTGYPVNLSDKSSNVTGQSCGEITDEGTNNSVALVSCDTACVYKVGVNLPVHAIPGINYELYDGVYDAIPPLTDLEYLAKGIVADLDITTSDSLSAYLVAFDATIEVPSEDRYTFFASTDDPIMLKIDGAEVINYDGQSGLVEESGQICLEAGYHAIDVIRIENHADPTFSISYESADVAKSTDLNLYGIDFSDISNLAYLRETSQSSTGYGGVSSRAVDGDTDGQFTNNSVTHTNEQPNPWWQVQLDKEYNIGEVKVYNRTDECCKDRLSNFAVSLIDENGVVSYYRFIESISEDFISLNVQGATGSKVRIQKQGSDPLAIAEVEIYEGESFQAGGAFQLIKKSASLYAINGGTQEDEAGYALDLFEHSNHENLTWMERDLGQGAVSYQKYNSQWCLTGGDAGDPLVLEECSEDNPGQQWRKIGSGDNHFRLQLVGSNLAVDGRDGRYNGSTIFLDSLDLTSENQQW